METFEYILAERLSSMDDQAALESSEIVRLYNDKIKQSTEEKILGSVTYLSVMRPYMFKWNGRELGKPRGSEMFFSERFLSMLKNR